MQRRKTGQRQLRGRLENYAAQALVENRFYSFWQAGLKYYQFDQDIVPETEAVAVGDRRSRRSPLVDDILQQVSTLERRRWFGRTWHN